MLEPALELSVVATVYNDAKLVRPLVEQIQQAVRPLGVPFEIILSNDRSTDNSAEAIAEVCRESPEVKGLFLARNYGQQIAMSAGIHHARGAVVVIMDGDLQHPPSVIPVLYQRVKAGDDVALCVSHTRNALGDELVSKAFWFVLTRMLGVKIVKNQLMMKGMSQRFVQFYAQYREVNRVVSGVVNDIGLRTSVVEVQSNRRTVGKSHQTLRRRIKLAVDFILDMTTAPLDAMIYIGAAGGLLAGAFGLVHLYRFFFEDINPGFTSIILVLTLFSSVTVMMLSIMGRYLANIYREVKGRPLYLVDSRMNFSEGHPPRSD